MPVRRLNHAVLYVRDVERSVAFYRDVLGFAPIEGMPVKGAAFLRAAGSTNDHDLGLFEIGAGGRPIPGRRRRPSASTTWPGRSTPSPSWPRSPSGSPSAARWSAPPTTARPRRSTPRTRTASSSR